MPKRPVATRSRGVRLNTKRAVRDAVVSGLHKLEGVLFLSFLKIVATLWLLVYPILIALQVSPFTKNVGWWLTLFVSAFAVANVYRFQDRFGQWRSTFRQRDRLLLGYFAALCRHMRAEKTAQPDLTAAELQRIALQLLVETTRRLTEAPSTVDISANVMVLENDELVIKTFDSMLLERRHIAVKTSAAGAGEALTTLRPVYVPDTRAPSVKDTFPEGRPYRSILSFPVVVGGQCRAVVNVDSTEPDFFDFEHIRDPLYPLAMLVGLSIELP